MADLILTKVANETKVITSVEEDHIAIKNVGDTQVQLVTKSNPLYVALDSRPASGPAGGDLTGAYPDPTLAAIGTAGTYTKVTTDSKGRITSGTNATAADVGALSATGSINIGTTSISVNRSSASQSLTGINIDGNAGTVTNGFYTTSSFNLGTTSIAVNRSSATQSLTGISIDGSAGSVAAANITGTTLPVGVVNSSLTKTGLSSAGYVKTDASGNLASSTTVAGSDVSGNISGNAGTVTNGVYTNVANIFTTGPQTISPATDVKGLVVKAVSGQSASLQEWQNSSGTALASIAPTGTLTVQAASTQDSVKIAGRAGGTNSRSVTITPTTLTASRTLTLPDVDGTVITSNDTGTVNSTMILDGTIVNADINASAAIADSKLSITTTVSGTAISTTNKVMDGGALSSNFQGQAGIIIPQYSTTRTVGSFSADYQYRGIRFYLPAPLTVTKIAYFCSTAATVSGGGGDTGATVDIAIYNSSNTKVFSTGPISNTAYVAGTTTGISSGTSAFGTTGTKVIGLASSWSLSANTIYYVVMCYGAVASGGTRASVTMHANSANFLFGSTIGTAEVVNGTGSSTTAPSTINTSDGSSTPVIALRTD